MKIQSNGTVSKGMLRMALYFALKGKATVSDCDNAISVLFEVIKTAIAEKGMQVRIRGFGTLGLAKRGTKHGRNMKTGEVIEIKECEIPVFRASKKWRSMVRDKAADRQNVRQEYEIKTDTDEK